jgi:hypothetical protein
MSDSVKKYQEMLEAGYVPKSKKPFTPKSLDEHLGRKFRETKNFDWDKFKEYVNTYKPEEHSFDDFCTIEDMVYGIGIALGEEYREATGYRKFLKELIEQFQEKYDEISE